MKCELCGTEVKVVGKTTLNYEPIKQAELQKIVNHQAEMKSLWSANLDGKVPIVQAMLQAALRHLHAVIEGDAATANIAKQRYWDLENEI